MLPLWCWLSEAAIRYLLIRSAYYYRLIQDNNPHQMERRSIFSFDIATERSQTGTRQIQIPLIKKNTSAKEIKQLHWNQIKSINDASNTPKPIALTRFENLQNWLSVNLSVINPSSTLFLWWNILNMLAIFYNFVQIPIVIFIASKDPSGIYGWIQFNILDICCLSILLIDMLFVRFRVAFYVDERLITNYNIIFQKYLKFGLWVDLISFFVYFFQYLFRADFTFKIIFYIKLYTLSLIDSQVSNKLRHLPYSHAFYRFIRMVGSISFLTSFEACLYFAIDYNFYQQKGTNYYHNYLWLTSSATTPSPQGGPYDIIANFRWPAWFTFAWYWAVQTTSGVGYGNNTPRNPQQVFLCNVVMLSTICIFTAFADTIIDIVDELQRGTLRRQAKFTEVNGFIEANSTDRQMRKKVSFFFECLIQQKYDDSEDLVYSLLSSNLQQRFILSFKSFLFKNLRVLSTLSKNDDGEWNKLARELTTIFKVTYHSTNQYLQKIGKTQQFKLSVIQRGKVTAFNDVLDYKKDYRIYESFGQKQFFFGGISLKNLICRTFCKFYQFDKSQFFNLVKKYESEYEKLMELIDQVRFERKSGENFAIVCQNCDESHLLEWCPVATTWRSQLPLPMQKSKWQSQGREIYNRKGYALRKVKEWKKQSVQIDKVKITSCYFRYRNI